MLILFGSRQFPGVCITFSRDRHRSKNDRSIRTRFFIQMLLKIKTPDELGNLLNASVFILKSFVAGERTVASGKIQISAFPFEINTSNCEQSLFLYKNKILRPFWLLELPASEVQSPETRKLLSDFSLITEILLD